MTLMRSAGRIVSTGNLPIGGDTATPAIYQLSCESMLSTLPAKALAMFIDRQFRENWGTFLAHRATYEAAHQFPSMIKLLSVTAFVLTVIQCLIMYKISAGALSTAYYKGIFIVNYVVMGSIFIYLFYNMYAWYSRYVDRLQGAIDETFRVNDREINFAIKLKVAYLGGHEFEGGRYQPKGIIVRPAHVQDLHEVIGKQIEGKNQVLAKDIATHNSIRNILRFVLILIALGALVGTYFAAQAHFKTVDREGFPKSELINDIIGAAIASVILGLLVCAVTFFCKKGQREVEADLMAPIPPPRFAVHPQWGLTLAVDQ